MSLSRSSVRPLMPAPFTRVPLALPKSYKYNWSFSSVMRACLRETNSLSILMLPIAASTSRPINTASMPPTPIWNLRSFSLPFVNSSVALPGRNTLVLPSPTPLKPPVPKILVWLSAVGPASTPGPKSMIVCGSFAAAAMRAACARRRCKVTIMAIKPKMPSSTTPSNTPSNGLRCNVAPKPVGVGVAVGSGAAVGWAVPLPTGTLVG